ncbi:MAG: hypothetical protein ABSG53_14500, partial [Thermoguttaceae bacterium]
SGIEASENVHLEEVGHSQKRVSSTGGVIGSHGKRMALRENRPASKIGPAPYAVAYVVMFVHGFLLSFAMGIAQRL